MVIENFIYTALQEIEEIKENAAVYQGKAAVFYQQMPNDRDSKWENSKLYPCLSYNVSWQYNPERKTNGRLLVDVYCTNENKIAPEDFAKSIVEELSELFVTDEKNDTYCLLWDRTDSFDLQKKEPVISGSTVSFDIIVFPKQEGISPCPVWSFNQFIKEMKPDCILIGHDTLPQLTRATKEHPLVYVRKSGDANNVRTSYAMAWMGQEVNISIISSDLKSTRLWCTAIIRDFAIERETMMENNSPFLITDLSENCEVDPLKTGQIRIVGEYGILRKEKEGIKLKHAVFEGGRNGNG